MPTIKELTSRRDFLDEVTNLYQAVRDHSEPFERAASITIGVEYVQTGVRGSVKNDVFTLEICGWIAGQGLTEKAVVDGFNRALGFDSPTRIEDDGHLFYEFACK